MKGWSTDHVTDLQMILQHQASKIVQNIFLAIKGYYGTENTAEFDNIIISHELQIT